jgi:hypothetical protein
MGHQYTLWNVGINILCAVWAVWMARNKKSMMSITHAYKWVGNMASGLVDG